MEKIIPVITIYTPIQDDINTLPVIYQSLRKQTNPYFKWVIINYGSTETIKSFIDEWKGQRFFSIDYFWMPSEPRHKVTQFAFANIETKYVIGLDGNYYITPEAVEIIIETWKQIEQTKKEGDIAEIRALSSDIEGKLIGKSKFNYSEKKFIDTTWHKMVLKYDNHFEMLASWNREKFIECVHFDQYTWHSNEIDNLATMLFWSSIGRKYQTRYLNKILKIQIQTTSNSKPINIYNIMVSYMYFIDENAAYFFVKPKHFLKLIVKYIIAGFVTKESFYNLLKNPKSFLFKVLIILLYIPSYCFYKLSKNRKIK